MRYFANNPGVSQNPGSSFHLRTFHWFLQMAIQYEFRFGEQYARMMLLFCMTIMFSVSCPLITPFGTLYFITKHYVDRHNLVS